jgi:hypothetical protein
MKSSNRLRKRLLLALGFSAAALAFSSARPGEALPFPQQCAWNEAMWTTYYSSPAKTQVVCVKRGANCGYADPGDCQGYQTPYYTVTCAPCPVE